MKDEGEKSPPRTPAQFVFLNVDLEIESTARLDPLIVAWSDQIFVLYHGPGRLDPGPSPRSRRHLLTLETSHPYRHPDATIHALCALAESLPPAARAVWDQASKRFDVGCKMLPSVSCTRFALRPDTLARLANLGAAVAVSVYRADLPGH